VSLRKNNKVDVPMLTDFALENAKLIMLFALIGAIIGLSHLDAKKLAALKSALSRQLWRGFGRMSKASAPAN